MQPELIVGFFNAPMGQDLTILVAPVGALFMKTVIFCRVSSKEQEIEGYSLQSQEKLLSEYAQARNSSVIKVFSISESASGSVQRNTFKQMLEFLTKNNVKILIVEKTDRLTRNHKDAVAINDWVNEDAERQVHFVKENFYLHKESRSNEKFVWNIKVSVGEYYLDNLSEEVKKGQKEKLAQGWFPAKPPLGYKTVGEKGKRIHVIDDSTKHYALKMFQCYNSGDYSVKSLSNLLYKEGLRSINGNKVPHSRIHKYLKDPFYIGINVWNKKEYPGKQEHLIDKDMFEAVQERMTGRTAPRYRKHNHLFRGLIKCLNCNGTITWEVQKGYVYGHCNHHKTCNQKKWSKEPEVEEQLVECFSKMQIVDRDLIDWIIKALKESHKDEIAYYKEAVENIVLQEEKVKQRLSKLFDAKLDGTVDEAFYNQKYKEYTDERTKLEKQRLGTNVSDNKFYELGSAVLDFSQRSKEAYLNANNDQRRKLLMLVFEKMWLDEGKLTYEFTKPFKLITEVLQPLNSSKLDRNNDSGIENFEPALKAVKAMKDGALDALHPSWLPRVDSNHRP